MKNYLKSDAGRYIDTPEQEEEIIELTEVVHAPSDLQEEIIELTQIVPEPPASANENRPQLIELTEEMLLSDKTTHIDPIVELSNILSSSKTSSLADVITSKFYEPIEEKDIIALTDQVNAQLDHGTDKDDLSFEIINDENVVELVDLSDEVDSKVSEPSPFTIFPDEPQAPVADSDDPFALDDQALRAGKFGSPAEVLNDASMAELIDLNEELDLAPPEPAPFAIAPDESESKPDAAGNALSPDGEAVTAEMENLPIESLDDAHITELIDLDEPIDTISPEPEPFTIPLDIPESGTNLATDTPELNNPPAAAGLQNQSELDFETIDGLAEALGQDPDDQHTSEVAEQLRKEMQAAKADQVGTAEGIDEFSQTMETIRSKLDSVFPDEEPTAALPNALNSAPASTPPPLAAEETDLFDSLFPEAEAEANFAGLTSAEPNLNTDEPPLDIPEILFPEAEFDPDMPQFSSQDLALEPNMPEMILQEAELTPDMPESIPAIVHTPEVVVAKPEPEPGMQMEAMVVSSMVKATGMATDQQIEAALGHIIKNMYGDKIEQMIVEAVEKVVAKEIRKIKLALLDEADRMS